jgi:hypothetical protein
MDAKVFAKKRPNGSGFTTTTISALASTSLIMVDTFFLLYHIQFMWVFSKPQAN